MLAGIRQDNRKQTLSAFFALCCLMAFCPTQSNAQPPDGVVPVTSEPEHKVRFDNGRVRIYEIILPKGKSTLMHEHRADNFGVIVGATVLTSEPHGADPKEFNLPAGFVAFSSTANGPYSHRVGASGTSAHIIAMELLTTAPADSDSATNSARSATNFEVVRENSRGRAYRIKLGPGEKTSSFTRPANSAIFAISSGRIIENIEGKPRRLWDVEPGHFKWFENSETLSLENAGSTDIELVEIDVF